MFVSDSFDVNEQGHLTVGGADAVELLAQYGSPLYVLDEEGIRRNLRAFRESIRSCYDGNGMVLYASKALCCKALCRIVAEESCGLDVVSGGEIYTAWKAGFPMENANFH
ncbi:MAG: diaminopimelate decarboxylase, partial [Clostridia bacterium]|nr:diaminopimelate decarboxylase [Clostridia bacterium]